MSAAYLSWVPETVAAMATVFTCNEAAKHRLITDPRMEEVWNDLLDSPVDPDAYRSLLGFHRLEDWNRDEFRFSLSQKAAAAMLSAGLVEFQNEHLIKMDNMRKTVTEWRRVSSWCSTVWSVDYAPLGDPELEKALARVASHFDHLAQRFESPSGPRVLRRSSRLKEDDPAKQRELDLTRVRCASMIAFSDKLYTCKHRKPLAVFCSVGLDRTVTMKDVDNHRNAMTS